MQDAAAAAAAPLPRRRALLGPSSSSCRFLFASAWQKNPKNKQKPKTTKRKIGTNIQLESKKLIEVSAACFLSQRVKCVSLWKLARRTERADADSAAAVKVCAALQPELLLKGRGEGEQSFCCVREKGGQTAQQL